DDGEGGDDEVKVVKVVTVVARCVASAGGDNGRRCGGCGVGVGGGGGGGWPESGQKKGSGIGKV
ncbi:hypothetical protein Tco_0055238, partial [Tanacetum coccineum]